MKSIKLHSGLSLVGVVISMALISGTIVVLLQNQSQLQILQFETRYNSVGNMLASEGVEIIRGIRDNNFQATPRQDPNRSWDDNIEEGVYNVDYTTNNINQAQTCQDSQFQNSNIHNDCRLSHRNGFYQVFDDNPDDIPDVEIYRQVSIDSHNDYITVTSQVKIVGARSENVNTYTARSKLYNTDF